MADHIDPDQGSYLVDRDSAIPDMRWIAWDLGNECWLYANRPRYVSGRYHYVASGDIGMRMPQLDNMMGVIGTSSPEVSIIEIDDTIATLITTLLRL